MRDNLESFALHVSVPVRPFDFKAPFPRPFLSGYYPSLTKVTLEHTPVACVFAEAQTPRLRSLRLLRGEQLGPLVEISTALPWRDCMSALSASSELEEVLLEAVIMPTDQDVMRIRRSIQPFQSIAIQNLRVLTLSSVSLLTISSILRSVSFPSLNHLEIHMDSGTTKQAFHYGSFHCLGEASLAGHLPSLRRLTLHNCAADPGGFQLLGRRLWDIPHLTNLEIFFSPASTFNPELLSILDAGPYRRRDAYRWLLPNLRTLSIRPVDGKYGPAILNTVRLRAEGIGVSRLHKLHITTSSTFDAQVIKALEENLEEVVIQHSG